MRGLEVSMKQKINKRTLNPKLMTALRATRAATTTVNGIIVSLELVELPLRGPAESHMVGQEHDFMCKRPLMLTVSASLYILNLKKLYYTGCNEITMYRMRTK